MLDRYSNTDEITIADSHQRVGRHGIKTQLVHKIMSVDRDWIAGQSAATQRHDIDTIS